jgi:hypothetical protein
VAAESHSCSSIFSSSVIPVSDTNPFFTTQTTATMHIKLEISFGRAPKEVTNEDTSLSASTSRSISNALRRASTFFKTSSLLHVRDVLIYLKRRRALQKYFPGYSRQRSVQRNKSYYVYKLATEPVELPGSECLCELDASQNEIPFRATAVQFECAVATTTSSAAHSDDIVRMELHTLSNALWESESFSPLALTSPNCHNTIPTVRTGLNQVQPFSPALREHERKSHCIDKENNVPFQASMNMLAVQGYGTQSFDSTSSNLTGPRLDARVTGLYPPLTISAGSLESLNSYVVARSQAYVLSAPYDRQDPDSIKPTGTLSITQSNPFILNHQPDIMRRSASLPSVIELPSENIALGAAVPRRALSESSVSNPIENHPVLQSRPGALNGVSIFYATTSERFIVNPDGQGVRQLTKALEIHQSCMRKPFRSSSLNELHHSKPAVRTYTVKINPKLLQNLPFANLIRSASLEDANFYQSVQDLHNMRYIMKAKEKQRHHFRAGKLSISARDSVIRKAYPPLKCDQCTRVFTGQHRRRILAGHCKRMHGHAASKSEALGSPRTSDCQTRRSDTRCSRLSRRGTKRVSRPGKGSMGFEHRNRSLRKHSLRDHGCKL